MPKLYMMIIDNDVPKLEPLDVEHIDTATIHGRSYWLVPATSQSPASPARPTSSGSSAGGERSGAKAS